MIDSLKINERLRHLFGFLQQLQEEIGASGIIVFPETSVDWVRFRRLVPGVRLLVASTSHEMLDSAKEHGFSVIHLEF